MGIAYVGEAALPKRIFKWKFDLVCKKTELHRYHKAESGTFRLLTKSSKAFAIGEDERNGVYLPWKSYLNMIFMIGQSVFYHPQISTIFFVRYMAQ